MRVEDSALIVDPHPSGDDVSCRFKSRTGHVDIVLHLPRIWWRRQDESEQTYDWGDVPLIMTRQEFRESADMDVAMCLRLPRRITANVGFGDQFERTYHPERIGNYSSAKFILVVKLADFADYSQIDQRLAEDACFNVEYGGAIATFIRVRRDPTPRILSFTSEPSIVAPGARSTLRWTTEDAEANAASIDPCPGKVEPCGSVDVTPSKTTTYTLRLADRVAEAITVIVVSCQRSARHPERAKRPCVKGAGGRWRTGRGFSNGELSAVGLTVADARRWSIPTDKRRRTAYPANIDKIGSWTDG